MSKTLKILWISLGLGVLAVILFLWRDVGITPRPVPLIKPSQMKSPADVGINTYLRLRQEIGQEHVLFLGIQPESDQHIEILKGFLAQAKEDGRPFSDVWCESELLPEKSSIACKTFEMNSAGNAATLELMNALIEFYKNKTAPTNSPILIVVPQTFSTHLLAHNPLQAWESSFGRKFLSISFAGLALSAEKMEKLGQPCVGAEFDKTGTMDFSCAVHMQSRALQKKSWPQDSLVFELLLQAEKDYLGLVSF